MIIAAMKFNLISVRFLYACKTKTGPRKNIWEYVLIEIMHAIDELGIDTPYERELAL